MGDLNKQGGQNNSLNWVSRFGFAFDPFEKTESSRDPHLAQYLIGGLDAYALAREDSSALVFAPPGAGKTAMLLHILQVCWKPFGGKQPFPIPFILPLQTDGKHVAQLEAYLPGILEAGARSLLAGLSYRPEAFLDLEPATQKKIASILNFLLPGGPEANPLVFYLKDILAESDTPEPLLKQLSWPGFLDNPPSKEITDRFIASMEPDPSLWKTLQEQNPQEIFSQFTNILLKDLGFRSIFLLVDGADAYPDNDSQGENAGRLVMPILQNVPWFLRHQVFVKAFLPDYARLFLYSRVANIFKVAQQVELEWTHDLLAEMVRKRVWVATNGIINSLDAFSESGLNDVETRLARAITPPLPREMLRATCNLMERTAFSDPSGLITEEIFIELFSNNSIQLATVDSK